MNLEYDEIILQKCEYTKYLLIWLDFCVMKKKQLAYKAKAQNLIGST